MSFGQMFRSMFGIQERSPYGQYAGLVAETLAASMASFSSYELDEATLSIDAEAATLDELRAAYGDCMSCFGTEYPETDEGCGRASEILDRILPAFSRRFPNATIC